MSFAVRLCIVFTLHALTVAHAGLQTFWSQRFSSATSTYLVQATKFDPAGDVILAGMVTDTETGSDLWVVKLDGTTGALRWAFRKNGLRNGMDKLGNIVIAADGDVYVAGALVNEIGGQGEPDYDAYLARLNARDGKATWEHDRGGNVGDDTWHDVALDAASNPVVTGLFTAVESNLGGDIRTAKYNATDGELIWDATHFAFETNILDQGERLFISPEGDVYVQGWHAPGVFAGTTYGSTVQVVSYREDGSFRWATRFNEGPNARVYGFLPGVAGGFVIGLIEVPFQANIPIITVALGKVDGTAGIEVSLPAVTAAPVIGLAENGDILFTGRETQQSGFVNAVSGRLIGRDLSTHWVRRLAPLGAGPGTGFAHAIYGRSGSVMAGIASGEVSPDLAIATYTPDGTPQETLFLDGGVVGAELQDQLPSGPTMDTDPFGSVAVAVKVIGPKGEAEVLVRRLRTSSAPTIALISPDPGDLTVDVFTDFNFQVAVSDPDNDAVSVEFFADGVSLGVVGTAPYQVNHQFSTAGNHTIAAIAKDATGEQSTTGPITVVAELSVPVVTTGGAERTGPATGLFAGTVENLPQGGSGRFVFRFAGETVGGFSTASVSLPANGEAQPVSIPFDIPAPHRAYQYFLEVTATVGGQVQTFASAPQIFAVPNAPLVAAPDFFFAPRGVISGAPQANDLDDDPGEVIGMTYGPGPYPGQFEVKGSTFTFAPNRDFTGELILPYTADDGHGASATETIVIRTGLFYAGSYRALPPVDSARLGAVDATVSRLGQATVVAYLDGARFAASGELRKQEDGNVGFSIAIRKGSQPDRLLRLSWAPDREFIAELKESSVVLYTAQGGRAGLSPFTLPQIYTLVGPHTNVSGNATGRVPAFASLQVALDGKVIFRGKVGDGTAFVAKARIREDGRIPIYTPLKGRASSFLLGIVRPNDGDASFVGPGFAAVQGPVTGRTPAYAADYRDLVGFSGPRFIPAILGEPPLTFEAFPRRLNCNVSGGGLAPVSFSLPVWISRFGGISGIIGITRLSVDGKTGEFTGAFLPAGFLRTLSFSGVLRPEVNSGFGVFRGPIVAGEVQLAPQ